MPQSPVSAFESAEFSRPGAAIVADTLRGAEDGELFVEKRQSESLVFDDGKLKSAQASTNRRASACARCAAKRRPMPMRTELSASPPCSGPPKSAAPSRHGDGVTMRLSPPSAPTGSSMPTPIPSAAMGFAEKIACCRRPTPLRAALDPRVKQVSVSMSADWQAVEIIRADGSSLPRRAPPGALQRFGGLLRRQGTGPGQPRPGRTRRAARPISPRIMSGRRPRARRCARASSRSRPGRRRPARWTCCSGSGWPGILLHEAIGPRARG